MNVQVEEGSRVRQVPRTDCMEEIQPLLGVS